MSINKIHITARPSYTASRVGRPGVDGAGRAAVAPFGRAGTTVVRRERSATARPGWRVDGEPRVWVVPRDDHARVAGTGRAAAAAGTAVAWGAAGGEVADPPQDTAITNNSAASIGIINPKFHDGRLIMDTSPLY